MGVITLPVVLIHGFCDVPELCGTFKLAERTLRDMGVEYFVPSIPIFTTGGSIAARTQALVSQIRQRYPGRQVHLFGHSMGGLNAREIAARSPIDNGFMVKTVTTFGTPHRGVKALGRSLSLNPLLKLLIPGLRDLTYDSMSKFNRRILNKPTVKYFSWAGYTELPTLPPFMLHWKATSTFGHTDSLVNTESAEWGTHLGTIRGVDHLAIVNHRTVTATLPHLAAAERGQVAIVQPVDNNILGAITNTAEGLTNNLLAPPRAVASWFGLSF